MRKLPTRKTPRISTMGKNSGYVARMETQLKKWDADFDTLASKGEKASAVARAAYRERIKGLRASHDAAQKALQKVRVANESAGARMQAGMEGAWVTMQRALKKAASDLKK
jgi:2-oxo-4-hydroxy-4-carboxy--5-ureidoimidazoline (OHCU) decarboxylase